MSGEITFGPDCPPLHRPQTLLGSASVQGLRAAQSTVLGYVDVFLFKPPADLTPLTDKTIWSFTPSPGGAAVHVDGVVVVPGPTLHLQLRLVGTPDPSRYRLEVSPPAAVPFDPLRTWLPVRLRPDCPDLATCFPSAPAPRVVEPSPVHDYSPRDWRSLRAALIEYLVREQPDADLSIADPTITVLELFAHVGDVLNYRLDRVATEGYLETARLRTSVKRHARLVDYYASDGVSARTFVHVGVPPTVAAPFLVQKGDVVSDHFGSNTAFTIDLASSAGAKGSLSEIPIYDWGEEACCLSEGATECVLVADFNEIKPDDYIAFELISPGNLANHDKWAHRKGGPAMPLRDPLAGRAAHVVRLTSVEQFTDPLAIALFGGATAPPLARVRWRAEDRLPRSYPVGIDSSTGVDAVTVARGNVFPAHHGRLVRGGPGVTLQARRTGHPLDEISEYTLTKAGPAREGGPLIALHDDGRPYLLDVEVTLPSLLPVRATPRQSLIEADPGDFPVVLDLEENEPPILRFRTGSVGAAPPSGSLVRAAYEIGGGIVGNVPANALTVLEHNKDTTAWGEPNWVDPRVSGSGVVVRNPVAASGGADPTPLDTVRREAPEAFAALGVERRRAVLPADHAAAAMEHQDLVQRAMARRSWTGSWPLITTVVDLFADDSSGRSASTLQRDLDALRMIGVESAVVPGRAIGLFLSLEICAFPSADTETVRAAVLAKLRPGSGRNMGVFHPDRLKLGTAIYISSAVAAAASVSGVDRVDVREARRLTDPPLPVHEVITFAPDEVGVLDDDPARPERGRLDIRVRGGR